MKPLLTSLALPLVVCATLLQAQTPSRQDTVQTWFEQGRAAFFRDDYPTAKKLLLQVNKADPKHQPTIIMLRNIKLAEEAQAAKAATLEGKMKRIIIASLDLTDTKVPEALEFLQLKAAELNPSGAKPNFILRLDEAAQKQTITLKLSKVSLHDALRAVAGAGGLEVVYDRFAVTVQPRGAAPPTPPAAEPKRPQ
jgi:hypothetical protein